MTEPQISQAPWTEEQVINLNDYQKAGVMHPFTCANRGKDGHSLFSTLIANTDGWNCPECDYTQNWAHDFMVDGVWREFTYVPWMFKRESSDG